MTRARTSTALALAAAVFLGSLEADAQPRPSDVAQAVTLFERAKRELEAGNVAEACPLFVESYRIDPQVGTLLNSALCHERLGRTATAWAEFTTVVSLATRAGQAKRADFARHRAVALEPKLPSVLFDLRDADHDVAIAIDGDAVSADAIHNGPMPIDPGSHVVVASAARKKPWRSVVVIPERHETTRVVVPALDDAPIETTTKTAPASSTSKPVRPIERPLDEDPTLRIAAWGTGIAAGVALGVGLVGGGLALSAQSDADAGCSGATCATPEALDANDRAHTFATVSTVGFVAAAALAATSVVLFVVSRPGSARTSARTAAPVVGFTF